MDRLRKIQVNFGRFHFHLDLLGVVAFIALGLCAWSLAAIKVEGNKERQDRMNLEAAILDARYHDCLSGNTTRQALTDVVVAQGKSSLSRKETEALIQTLKLSPSILRRAELLKSFELKTLAPRNCNIFTNQANPKKDK